MSEVTNAKLVIDDIAKSGNNYVIANDINRKCLNLFIPIECMPCIAYSTVVRIISCPFQCLLNRQTHCNPLASLLTDSTLTMNSDKCIFTKWERNNKKQYIESHILNDNDCKELIVYTSKKIEEVNAIKIKYALADALTNVTYKLYFKRYPTPSDIINYAASIGETNTALTSK